MASTGHDRLYSPLSVLEVIGNYFFVLLEHGLNKIIVMADPSLGAISESIKALLQTINKSTLGQKIRLLRISKAKKI